MLLWDCDARTYSYYVEVSTDQNTWVKVADKTKQACRWVRLNSYVCAFFRSKRRSCSCFKFVLLFIRIEVDFLWVHVTHIFALYCI